MNDELTTQLENRLERLIKARLMHLKAELERDALKETVGRRRLALIEENGGWAALGKNETERGQRAQSLMEQDPECARALKELAEKDVLVRQLAVDVKNAADALSTSRAIARLYAAYAGDE